MASTHLQAIVTEDEFRRFSLICVDTGISKKDLSTALHRIFLDDWEHRKGLGPYASRVDHVLDQARP